MCCLYAGDGLLKDRLLLCHAARWLRHEHDGQDEGAEVRALPVAAGHHAAHPAAAEERESAAERERWEKAL